MSLDLDGVIEQAKFLMLEYGHVGSTIFCESDNEENCFMMNVGFKDDEDKQLFFTKVLPTISVTKDLNEVTIVTEAYFYEASKEQMAEDGSIAIDENAEKHEAILFLQVKRGEAEAESRMVQIIRKPGFPVQFGETGIQNRGLGGSIFELVIPDEKYWKRYEEDQEFRTGLNKAYEYIEEMYMKDITHSKTKHEPVATNRILN